MSRSFPTYEYENLRRVVYEGGATFVPVCKKCGRFVRADDTILFNSLTENISPGYSATCSKCGRTEMPFEGFIGYD